MAVGEGTTVFVLGSINIDVRLGVSEIVRPGQTILTRDLGRAVGGKGANQAVAVAASGGTVAMIGAVGSDPDGQWAKNHLSGSRVDATGVATVPGATGVATIQVTPTGQNAILVQPNANGQLSQEHVSAALRAAAAGDALVAQLEVPATLVTAAFQEAHGRGVRTVLNASPAQRVPEELWNYTDLLVVNESEGEFYSGMSEDRAGTVPALAALRALGPRAVVQTLGPGGVAYLDEQGSYGLAPAVDVPRVVDTTGAGDAFLGGLVVAWLADGNVAAACAAGNQVAARCVAVEGPLTVAR